MGFLDTNSPLVLLHRDLDTLPDIPHYDLMLSPQFYVLKREELPVKFALQAKKLAPSILDDLVSEGPMTYEVFQDGDKWAFVACDQNEIAKFLESKGGFIDKVGKIYFADQVKKSFEIPVDLSSKNALGIVNDTVTIIPKRLLPETQEYIKFDESFRPEKSFKIQHRNRQSFIGSKEALAVSVMLLILAAAYFFEGYRYSKATADANNKLQSLLDRNPSLQGSYAREAIYRKYIKLNREQRAIRDKIKSISRLVSKKVKIDTLKLDKKGYKAVLKVPQENKTIKAISALTQDGNFGKANLNNGKLEIGGEFK